MNISEFIGLFGDHDLQDQEDVDDFIFMYFGQTNPQDPASYVFSYDPQEKCFMVSPKYYFEFNDCCTDAGGMFPYKALFPELNLDLEEVTEATFLHHEEDGQRIVNAFLAAGMQEVDFSFEGCSDDCLDCDCDD